GTPPCRMISACFPNCCKISPHARVEPTASPSARACEVSRKRWRLRISVRTLTSIVLVLLGSLQQFVDSCLIFFRAVELKKQFWRPPKVQPIGNFVANEPRRSHQPFNTPLTLFFTSMHGHQNPCRAGIFSEFHSRHRGQANTGIGEFPFDNGFD